jgi:predicted lipoprotein with Yx(FWY)xxD motif
MKRLFTGAAAPVFLTALLLAGCGSSSSSSSPSAPSSAGSSSQSQNSSAAPAAGKPVTVTTKHNKFGTVLAAGSKRTVYLFEADKRDRSNCASACASGWPPVIGMPKANGDAKSTDLSTITRANGKPQVTYKGHPLYYFVKDRDAGDTYGQNVEAFGAEWYVLSPTGRKIDEDTSKSTGS